jgi:hypothetical protein
MQKNKQSKRQVDIEAAPCRVAEMNTGFNNVVLKHISIALLKYLRTVVLNSGMISAVKQRNRVAIRCLSNELQPFINNYLLI